MNDLEIAFRNNVTLEELDLIRYLIQQHYFGLYSSSTKAETEDSKGIMKLLVSSY